MKHKRAVAISALSPPSATAANRYVLSAARRFFGLLALTIAHISPLRAQALPNFKSVWDTSFQQARSYKPDSDGLGPDQQRNWWIITLTKDRLTTSQIPGYVTLQFVRAWANLPNTDPKDPLVGSSYSLQIQFNMLYNNLSQKSYSFENSGLFEYGGNSTEPTRFFVSLPKTMIITLPISKDSNIANLNKIFEDNITNHESWLSFEFSSKKIPVSIPTSEISTKFQTTQLWLDPVF